MSIDFWCSLITLSLTHSWTLRVLLEHFGIGARNAKKARGSKDQVGKGGIKQLQQDSLQVSIYMYIFLTIFGMHGIECGTFVVVAWFFPSVIVFFSLALPFPDSHGVMGFSYFG